METHEVCALFPPMTDEEFAALKADVAAHGQREPVWTYGGKVIDGRNRLRACRELGIEPTAREWDGNGSLVEFVVSLNLHRRHLTSSQRAACGVEVEARLAVEARERQRAAGGDRKSQAARKSVPAILPEPIAIRPKSREGEARNQAAAIVGTSPRSIQDAKAVARMSPELHEQVKAGTISLPRAKREVVLTAKRAELAARAEAAAPLLRALPRAWEVREGDCAEVMKTIEPGSVRLVFADPPYNLGVDYGAHHDDSLDADDFLEWSGAWMRAAASLLAPDGSMWVLINDEWADVFGCLLRDAGLHRRAWIKWYESFGVNRADNFNHTSRHLFYTVKDPRAFVFHADAVNRPSDRQTKYDDRRADPHGKTWDDVWGVHPPIPRLTGTCAERIPGFPTQLPLALLTAVVGCASDPGDLVLDPFSGSATTGAACTRLGRRYLGIERSAEFADLSRMRLSAAEGVARAS